MEPLNNAQRRTLERYLDHPLGPQGKAYLDSRGLLEVADELRLGEVPAGDRYAGRLIIPSFSARGTVCDMAFRRMGDDDESPKYLFLPGIPKRLLGLDDVRNAGSTIHIAEGHPDRMTLKACGLHAVGVAGVNAWKPDVHRRLFQGFENVYYWQQSDDKGQSEQLGERIRMGLSGVSVIMVPTGEDLNSYFVKVGKEGVLALLDTEGENEDERDEPDPGAELDWDGVSHDAPPPF
jgi:DNA primase